MFIYVYVYENTDEREYNYLKFGLCKEHYLNGLRVLERLKIIEYDDTLVVLSNDETLSKEIEELYIDMKIASEKFEIPVSRALKNCEGTFKLAAFDIISELLFRYQKESSNKINVHRVERSFCPHCNEEIYNLNLI